MSDLNTHVAVLHQRLDHLDECLDEFKDDVMGGHGKDGELPQIKERLSSLEKAYYRAIGLICALILISNFLSGSGMLSLAKLFEAASGK